MHRESIHALRVNIHASRNNIHASRINIHASRVNIHASREDFIPHRKFIHREKISYLGQMYALQEDFVPCGTYTLWEDIYALQKIMHRESIHASRESIHASLVNIHASRVNSCITS